MIAAQKSLGITDLNDKSSEEQYVQQRMLRKTAYVRLEYFCKNCSGGFAKVHGTQNEFRHQSRGFMRNSLHSDQLD
ncbi:hypothetical protein T06_2452 [Trichinella sp. T6]|nr:hypothetical protein T06_2452 [Trichinella sp. T6]